MQIVHTADIPVRDMAVRLVHFDTGNVVLDLGGISGLSLMLHLNQAEVAVLIAGLTECLDKPAPKGRIIARVHVGPELAA